MHTNKAYEIHVLTCYLILMEGIAMILGKMNALVTSEMDVLNPSKINALSLLYVTSHTSCISSLILLWEKIHLKLLPLTLLLVQLTT